MSARLKPRVLAWLGAAPAEAATVARIEPDPRRARWTRIERLLAASALDSSPVNYEAAYAYVTAEPHAVAAIDAALAGADGLTAEVMAAVAQARATSPAVPPALLADAAEQLESRLAELLRIAGQQAVSARDYGAALDHEARTVAVDPAGTITRLAAMTRDAVTATRSLEERLEHAQREAKRLRSDLTSARRAADRDHLTGLANRRAFDARLAQQPDGCIALCDIDDFKRINDLHGHETGDRVLRFVAKTLQRELSGRALVARYGGEEFGCLFADPDVAGARRVLDALRLRLRDRSLADRNTGAAIGQLTFSVGLAAIDGSARTALRAADDALYRAKRTGKDRVEIADG